MLLAPLGKVTVQRSSEDPPPQGQIAFLRLWSSTRCCKCTLRLIVISARAGDSGQQRALPGLGEAQPDVVGIWQGLGSRGGPAAALAELGCCRPARADARCRSDGHGEVCRAAAHTTLDSRLCSKSLTFWIITFTLEKGRAAAWGFFSLLWL